MISKPCGVTLTGEFILSGLPLNDDFWVRLGLFRHKGMDTPDYAILVNFQHIKASDLGESLADEALWEFGPRDSIVTAVTAASKGASTILADMGDFVSKDFIPLYHFQFDLGMCQAGVEQA